MSLSLILLPLLMQAEPRVSGGAAPALKHPPAIERGRSPRRAAASTPPAVPVASRLETCMSAAASEPTTALELAELWLAESEPTGHGEAQLCLGSAEAALDRWDEAEAAFLAGRDAAPGTNLALRAKLGAMAGNAALARSAPDRALAALDSAHADALVAADTALAGDIAMDRARALVALKREAEAAAALTEARTSNPANPQAWLLSATLSRRLGKLAEAQSQIEQAGLLLPVDPEVGLEAGVIAVLAGHDEAARRSWQSVIAAAPGSEAGKTAKTYIEQLGPAPVTAPVTAPATAPVPAPASAVTPGR